MYVKQDKYHKESKLPDMFFVYFFSGLECVGHSFAYVALFVFLKESGFEPRELRAFNLAISHRLVCKNVVTPSLMLWGFNSSYKASVMIF